MKRHDLNTNSRPLYYLRNGLLSLVPGFISRMRLQPLLSQVPESEMRYVLDRVNYYNKLNSAQRHTLSSRALKLSALKLKNYNSSYFFDMKELTRFFNPHLKIEYLPGDITDIPEVPAFVKSRPITEHNEHSVLLKLNKVRHFVFVKDSMIFESKKNMLVWRGRIYQEHRSRFMEMYHSHPLCDIGQFRRKGIYQWKKDFLTIDQQLRYKFILCMEGNDVATNLKWVLSSSSVAVMPAPKFETWFMEGSLKAGVHYIQIRDDYSDLEAKLFHYMNHPEEALRIINNANEHVAQFRCKKRERLIGLLVMQKYFQCTGQLALADSSSL